MFHPLSLYIGLRYTRAKRRNHFISFISLISMLGIALGLVALIVVLSVMNGFHKEIQARILGMASDATLSDPYGGMEDWRDLLEQVRAQPQVVGAAPFVELQAMLANGSKVSGAMLRGIVPTDEDQVADVRKDMVAGSAGRSARGGLQHRAGSGAGHGAGRRGGRQGHGRHPSGQLHSGGDDAAAQALRCDRHLLRGHAGLRPRRGLPRAWGMPPS